MIRRLVIRFLFALSLVLPAVEQSYPPLQRQPVLDAAVPEANPLIKFVHGARIHFAPVQPIGLHRHPISVVGIVTEGSFVFQPAGEPARVLKVGDSFFEPAGKTIVHFDNESHTQSAAIVAYYLTDSKDTPLIEPLSK